MRLTLDPAATEFVRNKVRGGGYARPEDVVNAGLRALRQSETAGDFIPGELDSLLEEGEQSGRNDPTYSLAQVITELRVKSESKRNEVARRTGLRKTT